MCIRSYLFPVASCGLAVLALTVPAVALAHVEPVMPAPAYIRELLGIVVPLGFMIVALLLVLRLLRRRSGLTGSDAPLSVLQILPVGPRERVVLLRTRAGRILAVGVSAQSVNLISLLEHDDVTPDPADESRPATAERVSGSLPGALLRRKGGTDPGRM